MSGGAPPSSRAGTRSSIRTNASETKEEVPGSVHLEHLYFIAGVCVLHDPVTNVQRIYAGHTDDVLCLDYNAHTRKAASGQIGKENYVSVWDVDSLLETVRLPRHHGPGINCVAFSPKGDRVVSVGLTDSYFCAALYNTANGDFMSSTRSTCRR